MKIKLSRFVDQLLDGLTYNGKPVTGRYQISKVTRNLYVDGTYHGEKLQALVYRDGGSIIQCDALGRKDRTEFVKQLCQHDSVRLNGG